jgi:hypothetical protein
VKFAIDVARIGEIRNAYNIFRIPRVKRLLGKPRGRWKDIKINKV